MDAKSEEERYQVIVVGAGVSGLAAARHLLKSGVNSVLILEATSKPGGRISTLKFGKESQGHHGGEAGLIELGAQWIHGERNEFCQLLKASNHRHSKTSWEGKGDFLCPNGMKVGNEIVDEVLGWLEEAIEKVEATFSIETLQKEKNGEADSNGNLSMGLYLQERFLAYMTEQYPDLTEGSYYYDLRMALFQWGMSFQRIDNSCSKMNDVSLYRWSEFEVNPGEHYNNFRRGAQSFVDEVLVGDILQSYIMYNCPVQNIQWNDSGVTITTKNGSSFCAQTTLVTCSIGVLKSNLESLFTPSLPKKQTEAIRSTGYGPVTKIFLEWAKPWWSPDFKGVQLVWPNEYIDCCNGKTNKMDSSLETCWPKTITGFDPVLENPNVLLAWLGGQEAVHAETIPKDIIIDKCVEVLGNFMGSKDIPRPISAKVSTWNTNEYFQGAYSFRSTDGDAISGDICSALSDPITIENVHGTSKPVIVLAGEALSKTHYSTLHGAYESGIAQSSKLVQYFHSLNSFIKSPKTLAKFNATEPRQDSSIQICSANGDMNSKFLVPVAKNIRVPS
ncbi:Spermine oxidase [Orchesella cincta]|uniref:Spermine oxidase n=1 Tax=Orchesella cincta TaxID=48709 RepID=A0A1D2NET5_ORCCI|nr:Spermine oxidase [Orchesella cincta]